MGKIEPSPVLVNSDRLTFEVALQLIDNSGSRAAVILDQDRKVLGLLTDGDARRALLAGAKLSDRCFEVMNKNPTVANIPENSVELLAQKNKQEFVIRVDESGQFLDVHYVPLRGRSLPPALILAGGKGTRLRPHTISTPKPLLKVGNMSILERILQDLRLAGVTKFFISLNYLSEKVVEFLQSLPTEDFSIEYSIENQELGTAGPIFYVDALLKHHENFFVINGDLMATPDYAGMYSKHEQTESDITVLSVEQKYQIEYGVLDTRHENAIRVDEKPTQFFEMAAGVYLARSKNLRNQGFESRLDMPELINLSTDAGLRVSRFQHSGSWIDIGRQADFDRARLIFES